MSKKGTDSEIFVKEENSRVATKGRPQINRELAQRLILADKYTTKQLAQRLNCSDESIRRIKREMKQEGLIDQQVKRTRSFVEMDFDEECKNAIGISFEEWLCAKQSSGRTIFLFCQRVWSQIWNKPSLVLIKDRDNDLGTQCAQKFVTEFGEDLQRIRNRKKHIRQLFTFLSRTDLNDRFLTMRKSRDPILKRRIPEISFLDFPIKLQKVIDEITELNPLHGTFTTFKLSSGMRTGNPKREMGIKGLRKGTGKSYLIFNTPDKFQCHVLEKMREEWDISFIPRQVRNELYEHVSKLKRGDHIFKDVNVDSKNPDINLVKILKKISLKHIGVEFSLHDLRKVGITWMYALRIPFIDAVDINVGWRDLNTAKVHYAHTSNIIRKGDRKIYADNIPAWYKDGIEEFIDDE